MNIDYEFFICSFCNDNKDNINKIIIDKDIYYICRKCLLYRENDNKKDEENNSEINPTYIYNELNKDIIGHDNVKKILSISIFNHYIKNKYKINNINKSNILLIGPTGCGKTLIAKSISKLLNIPFSISDATSLTEAGYVGEDVESLIYNLLRICNFDIKKTEEGIIFIDEIDKISRKSYNPSITRDVSGEGVQQALLKIIEGTIANIPIRGGRKHPYQEFINIDTSNILFICSGSFNGLDKITNKNKYNIGFNLDNKNDNFLNTNYLYNDLIKYGFIPEFVGRFSILLKLNNLNLKEMIKILVKPRNSIINQYKEIFKLYNIEIDFEKDSLIKIAKKSVKLKIGARGLKYILDDLLIDLMFYVNYEKNKKNKRIKKIVINKESLNKKNKPIFIYE
ncbi:ATP-dependent Clp protease ATP-binding subunit ClpX [Candidatus Nardonella dryophthoridicola]|uniref:ATP-dependent Clp protease ATP-binding subunit ClpX n=1 Tax=endosymbiont of Rhynchophorus ferrugineus TaxID=1972133 RepID=A0A2Z5TP51_9GAMM|nr:ATP-dependent Clp protease ATP-binding subunit ClpX [Candidatus Nardonella dryophthoridicola]BBA85009.1 ATP-dependent Clp protease ATP-binding subunit ClpX [endosymbiont of Rhynchophorus ferrugineus]